MQKIINNNVLLNSTVLLNVFRAFLHKIVMMVKILKFKKSIILYYLNDFNNPKFEPKNRTLTDHHETAFL